MKNERGKMEWMGITAGPQAAGNQWGLSVTAKRSFGRGEATVGKGPKKERQGGYHIHHGPLLSSPGNDLHGRVGIHTDRGWQLSFWEALQIHPTISFPLEGSPILYELTIHTISTAPPPYCHLP